MSVLTLIIGFAVAVLVMPPATVEKAQCTVRRTVAELATKVQDKTNDDKTKEEDQ